MRSVLDLALPCREQGPTDHEEVEVMATVVEAIDAKP